MENSPLRAGLRYSADKRKTSSPRKISTEVGTLHKENGTILKLESVRKNLFSLKKDQSHQEHSKETNLCTESPRQNVRRKINFNSSSEKTPGEQESYYVDENPETAIPRRKKLRSEMTEDELWEGFPQIVRFKRFTPQKSPNAKSNNETKCSVKSDSFVKKSYIGLPNDSTSTHENVSKEITVETKPRSICNLFTDFSKVVREKKTSSPNSPWESKRKHRSRSYDVNSVVTPKRSARLQEKRDSPSIQKASDFIYQSMVSSEKTRRGLNLEPTEDKCASLKDERHNSDIMNSPLSDNITAKQLYRSAIMKNANKDYGDKYRGSENTNGIGSRENSSKKKGDITDKMELSSDTVNKSDQMELLCEDTVKNSDKMELSSGDTVRNSDKMDTVQNYDFKTEPFSEYGNEKKSDTMEHFSDDTGKNSDKIEPSSDATDSNFNMIELSSHADNMDVSSDDNLKNHLNYDNYDTESSICDLMSHLISRIEIEDTTRHKLKNESESTRHVLPRESIQSNKLPDSIVGTPIMKNETELTDKNDEIAENSSFKMHPLSLRNEENDSRTDDSELPSENQNKSIENEDGTINSAQLGSTLKMKIKKREDGAHEVYSGTIDDHAYVLISRPKDKRGKKIFKEKSSGKKLNRKRSLKKDESPIKRRSPRVANASSLGKGPGMAESNTESIVTDEIESVQKIEDSKKSLRVENKKKKHESEEEKLLKNNRVGKYACILWSSEQRRHHQQLNPDLSAPEVDDLMRKAWEDLENKDKLRYFVRASNAVRDEHKHSISKKYENKQSDSIITESDIEEEEKPLCPAMKRFLSLSLKEQDDELKRWLKLFYEVSPNEYAKLKTLEKNKMKKEEIKSKTHKVDSLQYYRQVLYQSILDSKVKITELFKRKKQKQQDMIKDTFGAIVKKLIIGTPSEELKLSRDVVSKKLAEVLFDLQRLENERKVGVSGSPLSSKSYENVVNNLKATDSKESSFSNLEVDDENENDFSQDLLEKIGDEDLPLLEIDSIEEALHISYDKEEDQLFSSEILEQLSTIFEEQAKKEASRNEENMGNLEINNPTSIINNWVLADQFKALAREVNSGSTSGSTYSLLDRKNWRNFLKDRNCFDSRYNYYNNLYRPNLSNNISAPKIEYYQDKIDKLNNQRLLQTGQSPLIRMVEPSRVQVPRKIRPTPSIVHPHSMIQRPPPGHTFVKFTSQPLGRCRVFSVRQTK